MNGWHWQDGACWQSCSDAAHATATQWLSGRDRWQQALVELVARQPLTATTPDALADCMQHAQRLRGCSTQLIVVGTGGASLGAQALCALADDGAKVRFLENCDPTTLAQIHRLPSETLSWCIVSKSGETVETLAACLSIIGRHAQELPQLAQRVCVITGAHDSTLRRLAAAQGWPALEHPAELGGRYSVFSAVGLLPAAYAGMDIEAILAAAQASSQQWLATADAQFWQHATWLAANAAEKPMHLLMAYADRLRASTQWYKQLWAESLGKDGRGSTPVTAIGAIDQHSQLQLYLDGPRDKLVTLWLPLAPVANDPPLPDMALPGLEYLCGHRMGEVMHATAEATATTLANAGVPMRVLRGELTPASLAQWMVRQMLETLAVAALLSVDPYSQPAVETGKQLTRAALRGA